MRNLGTIAYFCSDEAHFTILGRGNARGKKLESLKFFPFSGVFGGKVAFMNEKHVTIFSVLIHLFDLINLIIVHRC